jgi:hypothetical protein
MVFRQSYTILLALVALTSCSDPLKTKEKVQEAVVERLKAHSGLELKDLDVTTTDVQFTKNKATATVAFHPKGDMSVNSGMTMKYNLEERDGKWVVTGVNNSGGAPLSTHPPLGAGDSAIPAGHPSISEPIKPESFKQ